MKTNLCHISDNHGSDLHPTKGKDLLILSGDVAGHDMNNFTPGNMYQGVFTPSAFGWHGWTYRMIDKKAEAVQQRIWMNKQLDKLKAKGYDKSNIIFVPGNHDFADPTDLLPYSCWQTARTITVNGIKIGLLPGVRPVTGEWNDEISEYEIKQRIMSLDPDIELLVSHSAPYGIRDSNYGGEHTGSEEIRKAICGGAFGSEPPYFTKLKMHCFGHSHEGRGTDVLNIDGRDIKFSNAAEGRHELYLEGSHEN